MLSLNNVRLDPEAAREIVRYLSNQHGIAPEELRPAFYEVERRHLCGEPLESASFTYSPGGEHL